MSLAVIPPPVESPPAAPPRRRRAARIVLWSALGLSAIATLLVIVLASLDWNALRGPIGRQLSARMGRTIAIDGDLDVALFSLKPGFTARKVRIGNPSWAGAGDLARIERLTVQVKALPLLRGQWILLKLELIGPRLALVRSADGKKNWDFSNGRRPSRPFSMPPVRRFVIADGALSLRDARRNLTLDTTLTARETLDGATPGFTIAGSGGLNRRPFAVTVVGGPLVNLDPSRPYPFKARVKAGATLVTADGALPKPFDLGRFQATVTARGEDLANLYDLTGAPFPNTPPYRLSGRLARRERLWSIDGLGGRIGDSDMGGSLSMDTAGARPFLKADLRSRTLDFDDLATVFGGPPSTAPGETASSEQRAMGARMAAQRRLLPDAPLNVRRIRAIDADVSYRAAAIHAPKLPLRAGSVHVSLKNGLLVADRLRLDLPQGAISGRAQLDARRDIPVSTVDLKLSRARMEQLLPVSGGGQAPLTGPLAGRIKLSGAGLSVHRAMAAADGQVLLVAPGGEIREAFAELLGVNLTKGLGLLWTKSQTKVDLRCAVAHFQARDGVLVADHVVFDTEPVLAVGSGRINLATEQMDFRLSGKPKKARLVRLSAPITVKGPLVGPKVGVDLGGSLGQGGIAAVLATVTPLAVLLPFVDLGLAKDAPCGELVAEAARQGAPATKKAKVG